MGNRSVLTEIGSLVWSHPYVSCSLLVFLTPPFLPILKYFSPLLISTAMFVVALVTMGPHFEPPLNQEDIEDEFLVNASEYKAITTTSEGRQDHDGEIKRDHVITSSNLKASIKDDVAPSTTWSNWAASWKESGISWVEKKLQNENWKGESLNDDNVSILEEAFAHRGEQKQEEMNSEPLMAMATTTTTTKLVTRRIRADDDEVTKVVEEQPRLITDSSAPLSHSNSWTSDRIIVRLGSSNARDLPPHNFFSPHPSFSRRHDSDVNPLFENVIPPPIDYDMPPLITGPASITDPLFKSLEEDHNTDVSDDEYDHHHCDHDLLEVGESTVVDADIDPVITPNGTHHHQPSDAPDQMLNMESPPPPSTHDDTDVTTADEEQAGASSPPPDSDPHFPSTPASVEERSVPPPESSHPNEEEELEDVPELEDVQPVENESCEINPTEDLPASLPEEPHDDVPGMSNSPTPHTGEILTEELRPHDALERSVSLPILPDTGVEQASDSAPLNTSPPALEEEPSASLSHSISLPATLHPILQPITLPPQLITDTETGTATTFQEKVQPLILTDPHTSTVSDSPEAETHSPKSDVKISNTDAESPPSNSISTTSTTPTPAEDTTNPAPPPPPLESSSPSETETEKMIQTPSMIFQPDAPQLQITPPSSKVVLLAPAPAPAPAPPATAPAPPRALPTRALLSSSKSFTSQYSSSDNESADEEIDLDSDVEVVGEDSDSEDVDFDAPSPLARPPVSQILPAHTVVQA